MKIGFYSGVLANPHSSNLAANLVEIAKMASYGCTHYQSIKGTVNKSLEHFQALDAAGITCGLDIDATKAAWASGAAESNLQVSIAAGCGPYVHDVNLGHELIEWAKRSERADYVQRVLTIFPGAMARGYFGSFDVPIQRLDLAHTGPQSSGGYWHEYVVGGNDEPSILAFSSGNVSAGIAAVVETYRPQAAYVKMVALASLIYTHVNILATDDMQEAVAIMRALQCNGCDILLLRCVDAAGSKIYPPDCVWEAVREFTSE